MESDNEQMIKIKKAFKDNNINLYSDNDISDKKEICPGTIGIIYQSSLKNTNTKIIINWIENFKFEVDANHEEVFNSLISELKLLMTTNIEHEQIAKFYGIYNITIKQNLDKDKYLQLGLVYSYVEGISLREYFDKIFNKNNKQKVDSITKCEIILSLLNIVSILHKKGIVHRSIKPEKIMINSNNQIVLLNFGINLKLLQISGINYTEEIKIIRHYIPPEQFLDKSKEKDELWNNEKFDIWSIACIISEIFSGVQPYTNKFKITDELFDEKLFIALSPKGGFYEVQFQASRLQYDFPFPNTLVNKYPEVFEIIRFCLGRNVSKRLTCDELIIEFKNLIGFYNENKK